MGHSPTTLLFASSTYRIQQLTTLAVVVIFRHVFLFNHLRRNVEDKYYV